MKTAIPFFFVFLVAQLSAQVNYFPPLLGDEWETTSLAELNWCEDQLDELLDYLETSNTKAFLVLKDGKIVIESYFGDTEIQSNLPWNSAGKTLTAFMIGVAQENGLLNISDTTSNYLGTGWTSLTPVQEAEISIRNQLTMTTGMDDTQAFCVIPECLTYVADAGTRWSYHNGPYTLLQDVIESASGMTMNNYTLLNLKLQTGIDGAFIPLGTNNVFFGSPRGMARFALLMLNQGVWNNTTILSDMDYYQGMIQPSQNINESYGYLWWLNGQDTYMLPGSQVVFPGPIAQSAPADLYAGIGKNGQFLDVIPSQNMVVIRMGDAPNGDPVPLPFHNEMWDLLNAVICETTPTAEFERPNTIKVFPNPTEEIIHVQSDSPVQSVCIYNAQGMLVSERSDSETFLISHLATGVYYLEIRTTDGQQFIERIIKSK